MAKQEIWTSVGDSTDGKVHAFSTIVKEGYRTVHRENISFDTPEEKEERRRKLSAMCEIDADVLARYSHG